MTGELTFEDAVGNELRLRRLGYDDLYDQAELLREALGRGGAELGTRMRGVNLGSAESWALMLMMGAPSIREKFGAWVASVVGVSLEEWRDPSRFPLPVQARVFRLLAEHPDVRAFFFEIVGSELGTRLASALGTRVSGWLSTFSSPATEAAETTGSATPPLPTFSTVSR